MALSARDAIGPDGRVLSFGVEIVAVCESEAISFANVLSTCAFNVIKDRMPLHPGAVHRGAFALYDDLSDSLAHAYFIAPFTWRGDAFASRRVDGRTIAFLQMIGITEAEFRYHDERGADALDELFLAHQIDIYDVSRPSVV